MAGCTTQTSCAGLPGIAAQTDYALTSKWITSWGLATPWGQANCKKNVVRS